MVALGVPYLVRGKKDIKLITLRQRTSCIVFEIYSVVGVRQPDHVPYGILVTHRVRQGIGRDLLVAPDGLPLLETELVHDRSVVRVPFLDVRVSSREVSSDETEIRVMVLEADGDGSFVP